MKNLICCGVQSRWVENVPGKGYAFCGECRNEVKEEPNKGPQEVFGYTELGTGKYLVPPRVGGSGGAAANHGYTGNIIQVGNDFYCDIKDCGCGLARYSDLINPTPKSQTIVYTIDSGAITLTTPKPSAPTTAAQARN